MTQILTRLRTVSMKLISLKDAKARIIIYHMVNSSFLSSWRKDRVATVREKVLENEKCSRSGKSQGISFSVREIEKSGNFKNFKKIAS